MKFSVVVPIYNIETYVEKCIDTLINQTYDDFEIILVNDGSTDFCSDICERYRRQMPNKVKVVHKENGGLVSARQAGAIISKGEYIICVDGDDWVSKDYLEELAKIEQKYSPDVICVGHYDVIDEKQLHRGFSEENKLYSKKEITEKILPHLIKSERDNSFPLSIWAKAFKKELYVKQQMALNLNIKIGEDAACVAPCICHAETMYITNEAYYFYRHNGSSMTKNRKPFGWEGPKLIAEHFEKQLDLTKQDLKQQVDRRTVHALFNVVKTQFYRKESYGRICKDIRKQLKEPIYMEAIANAKFSGSVKAKFMDLAMKHKWFLLIWMYSKM